jgi:hypothetical protein
MPKPVRMARYINPVADITAEYGFSFGFLAPDSRSAPAASHLGLSVAQLALERP